VCLKHISLGLALLAAAVAVASAEVNYGELRIQVSDASGAALRSRVELVCVSNGYDRLFATDTSGALQVTHLPFGVYRVQVDHQGFGNFSAQVAVRSAVPIEEVVHLQLPSVVTGVEVRTDDELVDAGAVASTERIGTREIQKRNSFLPGRSVQDLIVSQPGWLYEGNAVLHPRGSEYQTQFVIDGIPYTDNRSPGLGPEIEADDLESLSVATSGFSAEYGRKMGGVVELNTRRPDNPGAHGQVILAGGAYRTASGFGDMEVVSGKNAYGGSASGSITDHYLNPVVPENYTNRGTTGDFSAQFVRDFSSADRLSVNIRHELGLFQVPNELLQQQAGQRQTRDNLETVGTAHYQHILSPESLITFSGMGRDNANDLSSNTNPTPIAAFLKDRFRELYFKTNYTLHRGSQEFKAGTESDNTFLHENFRYNITNSAFFDDSTQQSFSFSGQHPDLEQSAWLEDTVRLGNWTVRAGLRWDHYQLLLNEHAFSPRLSLARYFSSSATLVHLSFDRVFQTPSFENQLLSSSADIQALSSNFLRIPVQPSRGNYYEGGLSQPLSKRARLDANLYRRDVRNVADDDQLLNTGVSYPIAFNKGVVYGAEAKLSLLRLGHLDGFVSYSYMVGAVWFPVTGGLFLGDDANKAGAERVGHFPATQDQRNTVAFHVQYALTQRLWIAAAAMYGSGLPFQYGGDQDTAAAEYGPAVVSRINFARGRIRPQTSIDLSTGFDLFRRNERSVAIQVTAENVADRLNVIDFGGLFSGNAIGPGRSLYVRLRNTF
jgi:hypothetical protein